MSVTERQPLSFYAREFHRFVLPAPIKVESGVDITKGATVNFSLGSCRIECGSPCPVGTYLTVTLFPPNEVLLLLI